MNGRSELLGALETGGTTTRVAVASAPQREVIVERAQFPTRDPESMVVAVSEFFARHRVRVLGVAAFGPIDVDPRSPRCGTLLATPKEGWSNYPLRARLAAKLNVPIHVDTDVNGAALAEAHAARDAGREVRTLVYVTVGTGIGVGVVSANAQSSATSASSERPVHRGEPRFLAHHGELHPEAGHLLVRRASGDAFAGTCPFHHDCLEGLASATALAARTGAEPARLAADHAAWTFEADYLAQLVAACVGFLAPSAIVLGGGVMSAPRLLERVRTRAVELAQRYSPLLLDAGRAAALVIAARLAPDSGLIGALQIAADAPRTP